MKIDGIENDLLAEDADDTPLDPALPGESMEAFVQRRRKKLHKQRSQLVAVA